jgi:hypothetical protein
MTKTREYPGTFDEIIDPPFDSGNGTDKLPAPPYKCRFPLKPFNELKLSTTANYLVKGIIPSGSFVLIWGPPKCGKSFWAFDLFMHVALGWKYRDQRVKQGLVVYLALEGGPNFRKRIEAWRLRHLMKHNGDVPFYLLDVPVNLITDHKQLITDIKAQLGGQPPAAVVIDTLNRALVGSENDPGDMGKFIRAADTVRAEFQCTVAVIHHCGLEDTRPRGHTSATGAADAQIAVSRDGNGIISSVVEYMKDDDAGAVIASRLDPVELGIDEDKEKINSCVVVPTEISKPAEIGPKLSENQRTMFSILYDAGPKGLLTEEWNERARKVGIGANRKATLYDLRMALKDKRFVREFGDRWTVCHDHQGFRERQGSIDR